MAALIEERRAKPRAFLDWWLGELRGLLPARVRRRSRRPRALILLQTGDVMRVATWRRGRVAQIGSFLATGAEGWHETSALSAVAAADPVIRRIRGSRLPVVLRLSSNSGLVCEDLLPPSAEPELDVIMGHKIDLLTPWTSEQVYSDQRITERRPDGRLAVELTVMPRAVVDDACNRLEALGIHVASVDLAGRDPWSSPVTNLLGGRPPGAGGLRFGLLALAALLVAGVLTGVYDWSEIEARRVTLNDRQAFANALEHRLADLPALHKQVDTMRSEVGMVTSELAGLPSPLHVLATASKLLPEFGVADRLHPRR